jgi:hypothetical protein
MSKPNYQRIKIALSLCVDKTIFEELIPVIERAEKLEKVLKYTSALLAEFDNADENPTYYTVYHLLKDAIKECENESI